MKKFYAFAAAVVAALSMNAQDGAPLYVTGDCTTPAWDPATPAEFTYADGVYTIELANANAFKISTAMGTWDDFNAAALKAVVEKDQLGTPVALEVGDANINTPWKGDYKVVVAGDLSTITLTTDTPEPTGPKEVYVRGGMNDWLNDVDGETEEEKAARWNAWKFKSEDGVNYSLECSIEAAIDGVPVEFKIADADWAQINYSAGEEILLDEDGTYVSYWTNSNTNTTLAENFEGTISFTLPASEEGLEVKFASKGAGIDSVVVEEDAPVVYYNLQGVKVANPENGVYIMRQGDKATKVLVK